MAYNDRWQEDRTRPAYNPESRDWSRSERDREREADRGAWNRASDEVRSWIGDEEAERRRRLDEARERYQGDRWSGRSDSDWDYGRVEYRPRQVPQYGAYGERGPNPYRGPYTGRGPRGYQRSDERVREDVCDRLTDAPDVDASDLEIQVANCEVTLRGKVNTRQEKRRAEDIAEEVFGVRDVRNEIRVSTEASNRGVTDLNLTGERRPSAIGETPKPSRPQ